MATKDEITTGIQEVEERLDSLLPGIVDHLDQPLPEGTWTIHDAVCHMAADANCLPRWQRQVEAAINGTSARPVGFNLDEYNQQNIDARKGKAVDEVVQEIRDGLHSDAAAVPGLDDALLAREVPNFRGRAAARIRPAELYDATPQPYAPGRHRERTQAGTKRLKGDRPRDDRAA